MARSQSLGLRRGAQSFKKLAKQLDDISDATLPADWGEPGRPDTRDYVALVTLAESSLRSNLDHPDPMHRQGFLRALVDLVCINNEGCGVDPEDKTWDPIKNTAQAFEARVA